MSRKTEINDTTFVDFAHIVLSAVFGAGGMLFLVIFLFTGSLHIVDLGLGKTASLKFDALLCLMFFLQHSIMIRQWFRELTGRIVREEHYGALFSVASGFALIILVVFWQETDTVADPGPVVSVFMRMVFFLSIAGFFVAGRSLGMFDPFGIRRILFKLRGKTFREMPFQVKGFYRRVRHPLYFLVLLMIWTCPDLTGDRILFNLMWTAWIIVGAMLEERDLENMFGDAYRDYQKQVPLLIPYRLDKPYGNPKHDG